MGERTLGWQVRGVGLGRGDPGVAWEVVGVRQEVGFAGTKDESDEGGKSGGEFCGRDQAMCGGDARRQEVGRGRRSDVEASGSGDG